MNPLYRKVFAGIKRAAADLGADVYLVGGAVRDFVRKAPSEDLDFVIFKENYLSFARRIAKDIKRPVVSFKDNARIPYRDGYIDISAPRGACIEDDLKKRDFTINNLAMNMNGDVIGDSADILKGVIRPVYENLFIDDPLRILRGFRHAATLKYALSNEFFALAAPSAPKLVKIAGERISEELKKLSAAEFDIKIYSSMDKLDVWTHIFGFAPQPILLQKVMGKASSYGEKNGFELLLAALLAGNEANINALLKRLRISNNSAQLVKTLLYHSASLLSANQNEIKKVIWNQKDKFKLLLYYAQARYGLPDKDITKHLSLADSIDRKHADAISGNSLLRLIKRDAPSAENGRWIAELLEETKINLAFGALKDRREAEAYMSQKIKDLHGGR